MADTYTLIEKITVGAAGASSVTFTSIPQTYTDLCIKLSVRGVDTGLANVLQMSVNGSGASFSARFLRGNGATASSTNDTYNYIGILDTAGNTANTFNSAEIYIPNYTSSNNKSISAEVVQEQNGTTAWAYMTAALFSTSSAISSIGFSDGTSGLNFAQYSTFYLYGIAKEGVNPAPSSAPYATGGDSILFDGTYWIHTFTSSGTFTPKKALTCDYLVVAGGGGGGGRRGAGGGAGGLRSTVTATGGGGSLESALSLAANTGYTVTIGAGGNGGSGSIPNTRGSNGNNSVFSTITASAGGAGGGAGQDSGNNGGSGGGSVDGTAVGTGTANQGYAGGLGSALANNYGAGGGGGANAVGGAGSSTTAGNGGGAVSTSISGSSVAYAGGGGGGSLGGTAGTSGTGGGNGTNNDNTAGNGTANRGGGGGGGGYSSSGGAGGNGGSGIVIVRYAA